MKRRLNMRRFNFGNNKDEGKDLNLVPSQRFDLESLMDDFFEQGLGLGLFKTFKSPSIDIYEKDKKIIVKADLPGINKNDIKLHLDRDILTIFGETKREKETKSEKHYYSERSFGKIQRSIRLPEGVKQKDIKASYKDGVLEIEMPKGEVQETGRDIEVE